MKHNSNLRRDVVHPEEHWTRYEHLVFVTVCSTTPKRSVEKQTPTIPQDKERLERHLLDNFAKKIYQVGELSVTVTGVPRLRSETGHSRCWIDQRILVACGASKVNARQYNMNVWIGSVTALVKRVLVLMAIIAYCVANQIFLKEINIALEIVVS